MADEFDDDDLDASPQVLLDPIRDSMLRRILEHGHLELAVRHGVTCLARLKSC